MLFIKERDSVVKCYHWLSVGGLHKPLYAGYYTK